MRLYIRYKAGSGLGCSMSCLMLKECITFAKENHSKLFVCFLDVQKTFDCMNCKTT